MLKFMVVPIYDLRENVTFAFTNNNLANLHRLPLCEQDLPPETLVAIGYTISSYPY